MWGANHRCAAVPAGARAGVRRRQPGWRRGVPPLTWQRASALDGVLCGEVLREERGGFLDGTVDVLGHVVEVHVGAALDDDELLGAAGAAVEFGGHPQ